MGADFLLALIPYCEITPEREKIVKAKIGRLTSAALSDAMEWKGHFPEDYENEEEQLKEARDDTMRAFEEYIDGEHRRDTASCAIGGVIYLFSGGMSYGDSPTDAFDFIIHLSHIDPLFDLFKKWSREDIKKMRAERKKEKK